MTREPWYHPAAERELDDAVEFYEAESAKLAATFFAEIEAGGDLLCERPLLGSPGVAGTRRKVLQRFPYTLIYRVAESEIQIFAVAHHRRKPGYWIPRVR